MEPGRIEFIDGDGAALPLDLGDADLAVPPGGRRGRWPVLLLAAVILAACGGVLWHQHSSNAGQPASAPVTAAAPVTVAAAPQHGWALDGGVRPTGELLAEAGQAVARAHAQLDCMRESQIALTHMSAVYRSALAAGASPREAELAARAAVADGPPGGGSGAPYDALFRIWRINQSALSKLSGERLSFDLTDVCPG